MQLGDLFGYNEHYVGSRSTGPASGSYFLMGPRWEGEVPDGFASSFRFETDLVFLIGRTQLLDSDDQHVLAQVMEQYRLEPYEVFKGERPRSCLRLTGRTGTMTPPAMSDSSDTSTHF